LQYRRFAKTDWQVSEIGLVFCQIRCWAWSCRVSPSATAAISVPNWSPRSKPP